MLARSGQAGRHPDCGKMRRQPYADRRWFKSHTRTWPMSSEQRYIWGHVFQKLGTFLWIVNKRGKQSCMSTAPRWSSVNVWLVHVSLCVVSVLRS